MGSQASARSDAAAVLVALRRIVRLLRLADREAETAHGLSAAQLFVLHTLAESPARALAEIAARTMTDQSSVSTVVARLVDKKLVVRRAAKADRRRAELSLTSAGLRVVHDTPRMPQAQIADAVRTMPTGERTGLVRSLRRLVDASGAGELAPTMFLEEEPSRRRTRGSRKRR